MPTIILRKSDKSIRVVKNTPKITLSNPRHSITIKRTGIGPAGSGIDKNFTLAFINSAVVTVNHNLNKLPAVTVTDSTGAEVEGDIEYTSVNQLVASFSSSFTGVIVCN